MKIDIKGEGKGGGAIHDEGLEFSLFYDCKHFKGDKKMKKWNKVEFGQNEVVLSMISPEKEQIKFLQKIEVNLP